MLTKWILKTGVVFFKYNLNFDSSLFIRSLLLNCTVFFSCLEVLYYCSQVRFINFPKILCSMQIIEIEKPYLLVYSYNTIYIYMGILILCILDVFQKIISNFYIFYWDCSRKSIRTDQF